MQVAKLTANKTKFSINAFTANASGATMSSPWD